MGLASIPHISCDECGRINHVNTSDTHKTGTRALVHLTATLEQFWQL